MHLKNTVTILFGLLIWTVSNAQDFHVDGDIILSRRNYDRHIKVEDGGGDNLILEAGDAFSSGDGGHIILKPGLSSGFAGGVYIYSNGVEIAGFQKTGIRLSNYVHLEKSAILQGEETIGTGNSSAYSQLIFLNPNDYSYKWTLGPQSRAPNPDDNDFYFYVKRASNTHVAGYIQDNNVGIRMNFTGQHRSLVQDIDFTKDNLDESALAGLIVVADQNEYMSMSGGLSVGQDAIMIDESLPILSLSKETKDKRVFGVISGIEAEQREDAFGAFTTPYDKEEGDQRIHVNSLGEGGIWVVDQGGIFMSGDYIVTSTVPGYGMRQDHEFLANYTVAKITMDCNFNPQVIPKRKIKKQHVRVEEQVAEQNVLDEKGHLTWEQTCDEDGQPIFEAAYKMRYLLPDGTQISKKEYESKKGKGEEVYRAAFVGCTYHCG